MMNDIFPTNYIIHLELDVNQTTFKGKCTINLEARELTDRITIDADQLDIWNCQLELGDMFTGCSFSQNLDNQELIINLPDKIKGIFNLKIEYEGRFSEDLHGLYRSKYEYEGKEKYEVPNECYDEYPLNTPYGAVLPGDFNNDCNVDLTDFTIFAYAYHTMNDDLLYMRTADMNLDGYIDLNDFTLFASVYQSRCE